MENVFELTVEDGDEGVFAISFVAQPAIERDFVYLNKSEIKFAAIDDEKHLVAGPLLVPDKRILRLDTFNQPYEVYFTADTIEKLAQQYLTKKYNDKVTYEHSTDVKDVSLVESWVIGNTFKDKSNQYGFSLPKGTWFGIMKVNNPQLWEDVKTGKVRGFSIEGEFEHTEVKNSLEVLLAKNIDDLNDGEAKAILNKIHSMLMPDVELEIEPNPCWKGYEPIGLKPNGDPNCVPIQLSEDLADKSFSDYPEGVKNNAKRALEWANKNGWGSCGTPVGKQRANQLAKGEAISVDTIKRMYSFVSRHEKDLDSSKSYSDGCGKLMMDSWGGLGAGAWAHNKLKELGLIELEGPSIPASTYPGEKAKKLVSPALIGNDK